MGPSLLQQMKQTYLCTNFVCGRLRRQAVLQDGLQKNGDNGIRTRGLYVANVALSQLSYVPLFISFSAAYTAEKMETTGLEPATPCV